MNGKNTAIRRHPIKSPSLRSLSHRLGTAGLGITLGLSIMAGASGIAAGQGKTVSQDKSAIPVALNVTEPNYVIGVDDIISISAIGFEELTQQVPVLSDGTIRVKGMEGDIHAQGMTLSQLKDAVFKGLDKLYNNLKLSVSVIETRSRMVTIVGARSSGQFTLRKGMRISTLIAAAGGSPVTRVKYVKGTLIRNAKVTPLDVTKIIGADQDPAADMLLEPGDTVLLETKEEAPPPTFNVIGAVAKQGAYALPLDGTPLTLAQAIAIVGGQIDKAALARVALLRDGKRIPLNLYPFLVEGKADSPEAKMEIKDGDVLLFPETQAKYLVLGQVNRPSTYPLPETEKVTVLRALSEAGGANQQGNLKGAGVMRMVDGKQKFLPVDLQKLITKPGAEKDMLLQDGDVLYVPQKGKSFAFQDLLSPLFILTGLGFRPFQ